MLSRLLLLVFLFLTVSGKDQIEADVHVLNGSYHMQLPNHTYQYVFNIYWSETVNQYSVLVTGQTLAWATARLNLTSNTTVDLICDNGNVIQGIIQYPTDLPSICWPAFKDFTCWNRLLSNVSRIHVINMNHLDVGYAYFINNILNIYFHEYFPRAAMLAEQIGQLYPSESFVYTTHPWLLSMFFDCPPDFVLAGIKLQCPTQDELQLIERAIRTGAITWHAGAMNMEYEWMDERALNSSLDLSVSLAKRFDVPVPCVVSLRDVPGLPITMVRSLNQYFSQYCPHQPMVTVGANNRVVAAEVPSGLFRWGTSDNSSVLATWHFYGYPINPGPNFKTPGGLSLSDLVIIPQIGIGLAFAFRSDNSGPPMSATEVYENHEILRQSYPSARIISSTFQNFFEDAAGIASELPLFNRDISDSWLQGIASDPKRVQQYLALQRALNTCFDQKLCTHDDEQLVNASRFLIKIPEHTWGPSRIHDQINWSNKDFEKVVNTEQLYNNCRAGWFEQREFFDIYLQTVRDHPVYNIIEDEVNRALNNVTRPDIQNFKTVAPNETFLLFPESSNPIYVAFDENSGSIANLSRSETIYWTDKTSQLARFVYITYNDTDYSKFAHAYGNPGYGKPNATINAQPQSCVWLPQLQRLYQSRTNQNIFLGALTLLPDAVNLYGGYSEIWLLYTFINATQFTLEWIGLNKTATRLGEASMLKFLLPNDPSCSLIQYDTKIDVQQAATNSSYFQRGVDSFSCQTTLSGKCVVTLNVKTYDAPLACPILKGEEPTVLPFPAPGDSPPLDGMAYNLHNNVWDTNYIYWFPFVKGDESWRARFLVTFDGSCN